jgi:hypothetical protein
MRDFVERVCEWNTVAGNKLGELTRPEWSSITRQLDLLSEEMLETKTGVINQDTIEVIDGCVDVCVVAVGLLHRLGLTTEQIHASLDEVMSSNESKFTHEMWVAEATVKKYYSEGTSVAITATRPYVVKVVNQGTGRHPVGKILKAISYFTPDLKKVVGL